MGVTFEALISSGDEVDTFVCVAELKETVATVASCDFCEFDALVCDERAGTSEGVSEVALVMEGFEKNEDNSVCFEDSSFQYLAANRGTSLGSFIFIASRSVRVSPDSLTISSCKSMNIGQWSEPLSEGRMSPCLNHGKRPFVSKK